MNHGQNDKNSRVKRFSVSEMIGRMNLLRWHSHSVSWFLYRCSVLLLFSCLYRGPHQSRNDLFVIVFMNNKALSSLSYHQVTVIKEDGGAGRSNDVVKVQGCGWV